MLCHQRALGLPDLSQPARPQRVALTALKTSIACGQHQRLRVEFERRASTRQGYLPYCFVVRPSATRRLCSPGLSSRVLQPRFRANPKGPPYYATLGVIYAWHKSSIPTASAPLRHERGGTALVVEDRYWRVWHILKRITSLLGAGVLSGQDGALGS